jgi:hypothetical protein
MAGPATLYQTGDHASRPANGAGCVLYTCTTHNKVYRDDGSTWSDFIDLATGSGVAAHLADAMDAHDASAVSFDPSGLSNTAATELQTAMEDYDAAIDAAGGGGGVASGTSFPGSPADGDLYYRTDRDLLYRYRSTGTRWVTTTLYREPINVTNGIVTTSGTIFGRIPTWHSTYDMWLESLSYASYVSPTNTGAAYWNVALRKYQSDFATGVDIVTRNTSADTAGVVTTATVAIGALLVPATYKVIQVEATKTGSPSGIHLLTAVAYRLVG